MSAIDNICVKNIITILKEIMHKVTIITATTGSDYLKDNIRSVQAQTHKDVQHLLVVDGKEHLDKVKNILNKVDTNNNQVNLLSNLGAANLSKDIPQYQIDFNTYNNIESSYNNSIFDIKKMRYPTLGFYLGFRNNDYISTY